MEHFADALPLADYRDRARYRALRGRHGIGVVVEQALFGDDSGRRWLCIATDGKRFRHLEAVVRDVPPYAGIPTMAIERALAFHGLRGKGREATRAAHREIVDQTKELLAARFRERLTMGEIAGAIGVSRFHLSRVFRSSTGFSTSKPTRS